MNPTSASGPIVEPFKALGFLWHMISDWLETERLTETDLDSKYQVALPRRAPDSGTRAALPVVARDPERECRPTSIPLEAIEYRYNTEARKSMRLPICTNE